MFSGSDRAKCWDKVNNSDQPCDVSKAAKVHRWFECDKCHHSFSARLDHVSAGKWCPFCAHKKLCEDTSCLTCLEHSFASVDVSEHWHLRKNQSVPRDVFKGSNDKYWFKCPECRLPFESRLDHVTSGRFCPFCNNKTETMVLRTLQTMFKRSQAKGKGKGRALNRHQIQMGVLHQARFEWCAAYPFDAFVPSINTIVEIDGPQHFSAFAPWKSDFVAQEMRDAHKMRAALDAGLSFVRLCQDTVWKDKARQARGSSRGVLSVCQIYQISLCHVVSTRL
jgi:very-short-patch-repair endonuclease